MVPEVSSSSVFNNGRCQGSKVSIPLGGQTPPNSASRVACTGSAGNSAEVEKAQKQATKNITSEGMNRIMPERWLICTTRGGSPLYFGSRVPSPPQPSLGV